jgi:hypothetical protein
MMPGVTKRGDGHQDRTDACEQDDRCDCERREGNAAGPDQYFVGAADKLGQRVIQGVLERILTPEHVAHICAELQERLCGSRLEEEIAELDGRIVGVRRSLAHRLDVLEQGGLAAVAVSERLAERQPS